jgi:hypothetical protein
MYYTNLLLADSEFVLYYYHDAFNVFLLVFYQGTETAGRGMGGSGKRGVQIDF